MNASFVDEPVPVVVLVQPQLGENIGAVARAMFNCGLTRLSLVSPRDGWPNERAWTTAAGADLVLAEAQVFDTLEAAVAGLDAVYATTARRRDLVQRIVNPRQAARELRAHARHGNGSGLLFGPERTGLTNDQMVLADTVITLPLNPIFSSLNLAQAVLIHAYEWWMASLDVVPDAELYTGASRLATKAEIGNLFAHVERELDVGGFFPNLEKRPNMVRNIRALLQRARMTEQEVRSFHGMITAMSGKSGPRRSSGG